MQCIEFGINFRSFTVKKICPYLEKHGTQLMAWSPLAQGRNGLFTDPTMTEIGERYGKTAAQVDLRFLMQSGVVVIPKSTHRERMAENFDLFDFRLIHFPVFNVADIYVVIGVALFFYYYLIQHDKAVQGHD